MARLIASIQNQILDQISADPILGVNLNSPSKVAFWRLVTFVVAVAINLLEQVIDVYKAALEVMIFNAPPGSPQWIREKILEFQYSSDPNQGVVQIINFVAQYPIINPALRVVTNCAVTTTGNKECLIKVAGGTPPVQIGSGQLAALQAYVADIGFAGIKYTIRNVPADYIYIQGTVYYDGQYSIVINTNVIAAINAFITSLPFNGVLKISALEDAIQAVQGVTNVVLLNVSARPSGISTYTIISNVPSQSYQAFAGYLTPETNSGATFTDTLSFIPE